MVEEGDACKSRRWEEEGELLLECWNVEKVQLLGRSETYHLAINQYNKSLTSQCPLNANLRIDWIAGWQEVGAVG